MRPTRFRALGAPVAALALMACMASVASVACTTNGDPPSGALMDEPGAPHDAQATDPITTADEDGGADAHEADATSDARQTSDAARDAEGIARPSSCTGYASPTTTATCRGCPAARACQANGCFGSYWCELAAIRCVARPPFCQ